MITICFFTTNQYSKRQIASVVLQVLKAFLSDDGVMPSIEIHISVHNPNVQHIKDLLTKIPQIGLVVHPKFDIRNRETYKTYCLDLLLSSRVIVYDVTLDECFMRSNARGMNLVFIPYKFDSEELSNQEIISMLKEVS